MHRIKEDCGALQKSACPGHETDARQHLENNCEPPNDT